MWYHKDRPPPRQRPPITNENTPRPARGGFGVRVGFGGDSETAAPPDHSGELPASTEAALEELAERVPHLRVTLEGDGRAPPVSEDVRTVTPTRSEERVAVLRGERIRETLQLIRTRVRRGEAVEVRGTDEGGSGVVRRDGEQHLHGGIS
jgi:hypothetical protein